MAVAVALGMLLAGCTGRDSDNTGADRSPSGATTEASSPSGSSDGEGRFATLGCEDYIGTGPPPADYEIVLGAVALPASSGSRALQTGRARARGVDRLFAKAGLVVRVGKAFELAVPADAEDSLGIGWGDTNGAVTTRLRVEGCRPGADDDAQWLAFAGGYHVDEVMCAPLLVKTGGRHRRVSIGIGAPCPGQKPPARPSNR